MDWKSQVKQFKDAQKIEAPSMATSYIRLGFFGLVGSGKSVTSGIVALGITPEGKIGWIDGEGKRSGYAIEQVAEMAGKHYGRPAKEFKDRFAVIHMEPPFNPLAGVAAIEAFEEQGCKTIIADFCSQIWDSEGGYMDMREEEINNMAGSDDKKRQRVAAAAAAHVKPWTHGKFVSKVNTCKANIILVFQAKQKWNAAANKPDDFVSPIQESGLTRTALAVGLVQADEKGVGGHCNFQLGPAKGTKYTIPELLNLLPKPGEQMTFKHAEAVCAWVNGKPSDPVTTTQPVDTERRETARELHRISAGVRGPEKPPKGQEWLSFEIWAVGRNIMQESETIIGVSTDRLKAILAETKGLLLPQPQPEPTT